MNGSGLASVGSLKPDKIENNRESGGLSTDVTKNQHTGNKNYPRIPPFQF